MSLIPYLFKVILVLASPDGPSNLAKGIKWLIIERIRDPLNLIFSIWVTHALFGSFHRNTWCLLLSLVIAVEGLRLLAEYGQTSFSACWQLLPHRTIANGLNSRKRHDGPLGRYCRYFSLSEEERSEFLLRWLRARAAYDNDLTERLNFTEQFVLVPDNGNLLGGNLLGGVVRDVAKGQIWIRRSWTNDPWLLAGLAIRRSPWIFDPRYIQRPFYYRTCSARVVTKLVFRKYRYCGPFLIYQFGQEVRSGRYALFFRAARILGLDLEEHVRADGSYRFDPLLCWILVRVGREPLTPYLRPLWSDLETIKDIAARARLGESFSPADVAASYCFPNQYVEGVLWDAISAELEAIEGEDNT